MTLNGPQMLAALEEALRDIRREEDESLRKLGRGLDRVAKVREATGDLLRQLLPGRVPAATEAELGSGLTSAVTAARQARRQRGAAMTAAGEGLKLTGLSLAEKLQARGEALAAIDRQQAGLRALSPRIGAAVARDPAYEAQRQEVVRRKQVAEAAEAKARQAQIDREQKGRPFRADPLFSYLMARGYGTPQYRAGWLVTRLDGKVAALVRYEAARAQYAALNALPAQLTAHAEQQAAAALAAEDGLDRLECAAIDAAGGGDIRTALESTQAQIATIDQDLVALQNARDRTIVAQQRLTATDDADLGPALAQLLAGLGGGDIAALLARLRALPDAAPEAVLAQLDDVRLRLAEEQADVADQRTQLDTLAQRRRDLEAIVVAFKARQFDDPRSLLRDDDLAGARLDHVLMGAMGASTYWGHLTRAQMWSPGTSDWGGGIGLRRHGRDPIAADADATSDGFSLARQLVGAEA